MIATIRYGIAVVSAILIAALVSPLLVFSVELAENPKLISFSFQLMILNATHIDLQIALKYQGTVPLSDVELTLGNVTKVCFGNVVKGMYNKTVVVPLSLVSELRKGIVMSFRIANIYSFRIRVASRG